MELLTLEALWAILAIILIDIVLAGDNALVIGMAANKLPKHLQRRAIVAGTAGAILIRFISVLLLTWLLTLPGLRLVGAIALLWIGWQLVNNQKHDVNVTTNTTFLGAMSTIIVADAVMGIDNALAIAAAANGNMLLVVFGLAISVPIILFGASIVTKILSRWPDLVYFGSLVLFVVAIQMLIKEPLLEEWFNTSKEWVLTVLPWALAIVITSVQYNISKLKLTKKYLLKRK